MNFVSLFSRKESIAAIDITADAVRFVLLAQHPKKDQPTITFIYKESLPAGVISGGKVRKPDQLIAALRTVYKKVRKRGSYVILTLPPFSIYTKVFQFPENVRGSRLNDAMQIASQFQLPFDIADSYIDWEKATSSSGQNEVLVAAMKKTAADPFISAVSSAGFHVVAVEFHALSVARALAPATPLPSADSFVLVMQDASGITISVIQDRQMRLTRHIPPEFIKTVSLGSEIDRIANFYESTSGSAIRIVDIRDQSAHSFLFTDSLLRNVRQKNEWLPALGAALRGLVPRKNDVLVSLMPIGTEQAYEYQKRLAFINLTSSITIGFCILLISTFIGSWLLAVYLQQSTNQEIQVMNSAILPAESVALQERATNLDTLVATSDELVRVLPRWSIVLEKVHKIVPPGIAIGNIVFPSPSDTMSITGVAKSRTDITQLKKSLSDSTYFVDVQTPLTNFEKKEQIPFSITARISNPSILYVDSSDK